MKKLLFIIIAIMVWPQLYAATLEEQANAKIAQLEALITTAKNAGFDVIKEEMTVYNAKLFISYAQWDQNNIATNTTQFAAHSTYSSQSQAMATALPDWERNEVIKSLDKQIAEISKVISGEIKRKDTFWPDWNLVKVEADQITQNGRPVFLADYIWKPDTPELTKYYGATDSEGMRSVYITNDQGGYNTWAYTNNFVNHKENTIGQIWTDNNNIPAWIKTKYPEIQDGGRHYGHFDVDHPAMRELYATMYKQFVPPIADKKVTALGYQLFNEPSFFTKAGSWNNADENSGKCVSAYTIAKFKTWLKDLHGNIATLNSLWGTSFANFDAVTVTLPMPANLQGGAIWYDWMSFNNYRITSWFQFMTNEIKKYDSDARTHIKLMPWTFTTNDKDHGLDFEALTELSGIIGCDAGMQYDHSWNANGWWRSHFALDWKPAIMTFDFMKSVKPESFIFDTENHFTMNTGFNMQDLNQDYVRMAYWLGSMHGLTVKNTWVWTRNADGSMTRTADQSNMTDMSHQPQTLYTITSTFMDLNAYAEEMVAIQRLAKPIRVFYSKTSSLNDNTYLDKVFETYKSVFFEGIPVGFVTENILNRGTHDGEVVIVHNTKYVTTAELAALQAYLNGGGTIIMGTNSLQKDQYGRNLSALTAGNGTIINAANIDAIRTSTLSVIQSKGKSPEVTVTETNANNVKGCTWKYIKRPNGNYVLSIINLGNKNATLTLGAQNITNLEIKDLFTGKVMNATQVLAPFGVLFLEMYEPSASIQVDAITGNTIPASMYEDGIVSFTVNYTASTDRDIHVDLQRITPSNWGGCGTVVKTVAAGSGTATFNFSPNVALSSNDLYRWNIYMTEKGKNYTFTISGTASNKSVTVTQKPANSLIIEAESFTTTGGTYVDGVVTGNGVKRETAIISYVNNGDWAEYTINVTEAGSYSVNYLYSAPADGGQIQFLLANQIIATDNVPGTGIGTNDWTQYKDLKAANTVYFTQGSHTIRIQASNAKEWQWNLDKITLTKVVTTDISTQESGALMISPNPFDAYLTIKGDRNMANVEIKSMQGMQMLWQPIQTQSLSLETSWLKKGTYLLIIRFEDESTQIYKVLKL